ncbi:MAG TPA: hypothetical protein ENO02_06450 [Epsilonproteobacteria bacterium]|nr:hypothetical protein [Campylobacterota bacterium]
MQQFEPTLESLEDYRGKASPEKKLTVWVVILSGLLVGALYTIVKLNSGSPAEVVNHQEETAIFKY